jgi:hypothetical protein
MILGTMREQTEAVVGDYTGRFVDERLERRGRKIMKNMLEKETAVLNQLFDNRSEYVGASRFFLNESVLEEALREESGERCKKATHGRHVLAIQDTSEINYQKHRGKFQLRDQELGPVGNNKDIGFFIHPMLVLERENGFPLGIADTHVWNRNWKKKNKKERNYKSQPIEEKESYRWIECAQRSKEVLENAASVTIVADREGDIFEELVEVPDDKTDVVIRSLHDRRLYDSEKKLFEHLSDLEVVGTYDLEVKKCQKKRIPRMAKMEVRYDLLKIAKPSSGRQEAPEYVEVYAIEAKESTETIPASEDGIVWRILTTHEINCLEDALEIIHWYSLRWRIEELFRTLKKEGLNVEGSQLETGAGLKKLVLMALNAALIIMQLVGDRDGEAGKPGNLVFTSAELECLECVSKEYEGQTKLSKNPNEVYSLAWAAWIIGRMGGWKGYRKAGPAGPVTMKRGLQKFSLLFEGWKLREALEMTQLEAPRYVSLE